MSGPSKDNSSVCKVVQQLKFAQEADWSVRSQPFILRGYLQTLKKKKKPEKNPS